MLRPALRRCAVTAAAALALGAVVTGTAVASPAPTALDHPDGVSPNWVTEHAGCSFVTAVPSVGGVTGQGFSNLWLIKIDPGTGNSACRFDGYVANDVKNAPPGAPSRRVSFAGGNDGLRDQYASTEAEGGLHPYTVVMRVCNGADCSGYVSE